MSAAEDVLEMKALTNELADLLVGVGARMKVRIGAVVKAVSAGSQQTITDNRAKEFLRGEALRVDSWEKDNARRQRAELKRREQEAQEHAHLLWLEAEIARHRASGSGFRGPHVDGLEHLLRVARSADRAVAGTAQPEEGAEQ